MLSVGEHVLSFILLGFLHVKNSELFDVCCRQLKGLPGGLSFLFVLKQTFGFFDLCIKLDVQQM